jgi:uncharacterized membrane protein YgcG
VRRSIIVAVLCFAALGASAKSLYWRDLGVVANLDRDGRLHVVETQQIVFDGDWNGGERRFRVSPFQSLNLEGLTRVGPDGREKPVVQGPLDAVDHYQMLAGDVLRWRSRLPTDPEFDKTALTYRIRYSMTGVVQKIKGRSLIDHDFAFPDRDGVIEHFHLHFTADPAWHGIESPLDIERANMPPGVGVVVTRNLTYTGSGKPAAIIVGVSQATAVFFGVLLLLGVALLAFAFYTSEAARGRFAHTPATEIDEQWLKENVFHLEPEIAGAALHNKVGPPEVAAVLASLAQEKKIETTVEKHMFHKPKLTMKLLVAVDDLDDRRRALVKKLFFDRKVVNTDDLREHYENTGFDPAAVIKPSIDAQLERLPKWNANPKIVNWWVDGALLFAALVLFPLLAGSGNGSALASISGFWGVISLVGALTAAGLSSRAVTALPARFAQVGAFLLPQLIVTTHYLFAAPRFFFHIPALVGAILWELAVVHIVLDMLRIKDSDEKLALRVKLASARRYFLTQLNEREPRLHDEWFPWIIALGLGKNVDSWFSENAKYAGTTHSGGFGTSSSSSSGSSWSGGGGAFGGAGASASWAMAAGAISSGVSAPGSGGGGGGGGGGGSSGGGGGGGW